jgi:hypothetical protein
MDYHLKNAKEIKEYFVLREKKKKEIEGTKVLVLRV